jgi:hypothetical protein
MTVPLMAKVLRVPPGPHPSPEQLHRARREKNQDVLAHASLCATCAEEESALDAFDSPEPMVPAALDAAWARFGRTGAERRRFGWRPGPALFALAACLLVAVGVAVLAPRPDTGETRGASVAVRLLSPQGALEEPPVEFRFALETPGRARVTVFDFSQSYLWKSEPGRTGRVEFPRFERYKIVPGAEYFWMVEMNGEVTPAQLFVVRPEETAFDAGARIAP